MQYMFISIFAFSIMHLCVKAIPSVPLHQIITIRSAISLIFCIYMLNTSGINPWGINKVLLMLRAMVGILSLFAFFYSVQHLPLGVAITISNLIPLFTLTMAALFLKEKIRIHHIFFFLICFAGVLLIKGFNSDIDYIDFLICLSGSFFAACAHFLVRKLRDSEHTEVIIFYFPMVALLIVGPYTLLHWYEPDWQDGLLLCVIGLTTHIGQVYLTRAYEYEEVSGVTNVYFAGIVLSVVYGYIFFDEKLPLQTWLGIILISGGIYLSSMNKHKAKKEN
ncbi:MAG: DMT family transporter [Cytophagaceae bacterium]|nr:DMT family transporter [Cytophagaceae bacterium]